MINEITEQDKKSARDFSQNEYSSLVCHEDDFELGFLVGINYERKRIKDEVAKSFYEWCVSPDESDFERDLMKLAYQAGYEAALKGTD